MDQFEEAFEELRKAATEGMLEDGIDPNDSNAKIEFYKEFLENDLKPAEDIPVLVKRILIVIFEYEIELLETMPQFSKE